MPAANKPEQSPNPLVRAMQRVSDAAAHRSRRVMKALQGSTHGNDGDEEDDDDDVKLRAGMMKAMSQAEAAMSEATSILKQLDHAAEELFMKVTLAHTD